MKGLVRSLFTGRLFYLINIHREVSSCTTNVASHQKNLHAEGYQRTLQVAILYVVHERSNSSVFVDLKPEGNH